MTNQIENCKFPQGSFANDPCNRIDCLFGRDKPSFMSSSP